MNDRNTAGISTGSVSILAIFVVLCLTTLATLALVSARADATLTEKTMQAEQQYYAADAAAEDQLAGMVGLLEDGGIAAVERDARFTVADAEGGAVVGFSVPVNGIKTIRAAVWVGLDGGAFTGDWQRVSWQTVVDDSALVEPEPTLNVLK